MTASDSGRLRTCVMIAALLSALSSFAGCAIRPAESLDDGTRTLTESVGKSLPNDARLGLYSGTRDGGDPIWVILHQDPLTLSTDADESTCPVSAVAAILSALRADSEVTGTIQSEVGRVAIWRHGEWEFRSREVRTNLGLLTIIERLPTESN